MSEGGPGGLLLCKTPSRFQRHASRRQVPGSARSSLDLAWSLARGAARSGIRRPQMQNSGAQPLPEADLCWLHELCFSCLLHQVSSYPDVPPGDRPPRPSTSRVQPRSFRGCASDPGPGGKGRRVLARRGAAVRAARESLSSSNREPRFLVSFWTLAAEQIHSACKLIAPLRPPCSLRTPAPAPSLQGRGQ